MRACGLQRDPSAEVPDFLPEPGALEPLLVLRLVTRVFVFGAHRKIRRLTPTQSCRTGAGIRFMRGRTLTAAG